MTEIRNSMRIEDVLRVKASGAEADVLVSPRSSRSGIEGIDRWRKRLIIKVKAPPLDGKANKEVEDILREATGYSSKIVSGHTDRQKTVLIEGDPAIIIEKLREHVER
jgi:uncharacterized protein (TIGR00251 family)